MPETNAYREIRYRSSDGLDLSMRLYGKAQSARTPVVCLPGLTRNSRDFHELALFLSRDAENPRMVATFDYRGRGRSARDPDWKNYAVPVEAADVMTGMAAAGIGRAAFIGTSRGGIITMVLAATRPELVACAVLNDIGPVIEAEGLVHIRDYLSRAIPPETLEEAIAQQKRVHGPAFPALSDNDWERFVLATHDLDGGKPVAAYDPALLEGLKNMDLSGPLPTMWPQFAALAAVPILVIRGANSRLLSETGLAEMKARHPAVETLTVEGQGHAPFLETGVLPEEIAAFIDHSTD